MEKKIEEAEKAAVHAHYPCMEYDYCEHCDGHNTAFDCRECGVCEFKEGFIQGAK